MVRSFSSSSRDHSVFLMDGSNQLSQRDLHCFALFLESREAHRDHWFSPYLLMAAFSTSSSTFDQVDVTTILDGLAGLWRDSAREMDCVDGSIDRETEKFKGPQILAPWQSQAPRRTRKVNVLSLPYSRWSREKSRLNICVLEG